MIYYGIHYCWDSIVKGVGGRVVGVGWMVAMAKTKKQDNTMVEFRMALMLMCTHKGPILYYKA